MPSSNRATARPAEFIKYDCDPLIWISLIWFSNLKWSLIRDPLIWSHFSLFQDVYLILFTLDVLAFAGNGHVAWAKDSPRYKALHILVMRKSPDIRSIHGSISCDENLPLMKSARHGSHLLPYGSRTAKKWCQSNSSSKWCWLFKATMSLPKNPQNKTTQKVPLC